MCGCSASHRKQGFCEFLSRNQWDPACHTKEASYKSSCCNRFIPGRLFEFCSKSERPDCKQSVRPFFILFPFYLVWGNSRPGKGGGQGNGGYPAHPDLTDSAVEDDPYCASDEKSDQPGPEPGRSPLGQRLVRIVRPIASQSKLPHGGKDDGTNENHHRRAHKDPSDRRWPHIRPPVAKLNILGGSLGGAVIGPSH